MTSPAPGSPRVSSYRPSQRRHRHHGELPRTTIRRHRDRCRAVGIAGGAGPAPGPMAGWPAEVGQLAFATLALPVPARRGRARVEAILADAGLDTSPVTGVREVESVNSAEKVDYFDVWNEMKGFWSSSTNTWNDQGTRRCTTTCTAPSRRSNRRPDRWPVRPGACYHARRHEPPLDGQRCLRRGRPARALKVLTYWLQHEFGAQPRPHRRRPEVTKETGFAAGAYFSAVTRWLRRPATRPTPGARTLPITWAELSGPGLDVGPRSGAKGRGLDASNIIKAGVAGVGKMLLWEIEGPERFERVRGPMTVLTDTAARRPGVARRPPTPRSTTSRPPSPPARRYTPPPPPGPSGPRYAREPFGASCSRRQTRTRCAWLPTPVTVVRSAKKPPKRRGPTVEAAWPPRWA